MAQTEQRWIVQFDYSGTHLANSWNAEQAPSFPTFAQAVAYVTAYYQNQEWNGKEVAPANVLTITEDQNA